jgi:DNA-binding NarL/FixJ family response regulator
LIVRAAQVALVLRRQAWVARCLLAADTTHAVELARHRPEVAVVDISETGPFVAGAIEPLRRAHPGLSIVLTSRCQRVLPAPPQAVGAASFIRPGSPTEEIVAAVRAVLSIDHAQPAPTSTTGNASC